AESRQTQTPSTCFEPKSGILTVRKVGSQARRGRTRARRASRRACRRVWCIFQPPFGRRNRAWQGYTCEVAHADQKRDNSPAEWGHSRRCRAPPRSWRPELRPKITGREGRGWIDGRSIKRRRRSVQELGAGGRPRGAL